MTFTAGQVLTAAELNALDITSLTVDTTTLVVDATNNRVGIGTASPTDALDVDGNVDVSGTLTVDGIVTTGDEIRGGSGSASDPVFTFASDSNTGLYSYSADNLGFTTGGAAAARISSANDLYLAGDYLAFNSVSSVDDSIRVNGDQFQFRTGGTDRMHLTSSGYLEVTGRRYYFGLNSNDYIAHNDTNNEYQFYSDGTLRFTVGYNGSQDIVTAATGTFKSFDSGLQFPTGSGTDARIITGFGLSALVKYSSLAAEKENISADLGTHLTVSMIDDVVPKMWNRISAPGYPEIGPIADEMEAISPFLATHGTDADGDQFLSGVETTAWLSLMTLAIQDLRSRVATLEA